MSRLVLFLIILVIWCTAGIVYLLYMHPPSFMPRSSSDMWTFDDQRELAAKLKGSGLTVEAVKKYAQYARTAQLDRKTYPTCYMIGKMCMEAGDNEKALAWLYRVEIADPNSKSKAEASSAIITCLERLGKYSTAEHALSRRASLSARNPKAAGTVIAEIGEDISGGHQRSA